MCAAGLSHSHPSASLPRPNRSTSARLLRTWPAPRARWSTPSHREGMQPLLADERQIPTRRTSVPTKLWPNPSFFWWQWRVLPRKMRRPRKPTRRSVRESMLAPASPRTGRRESAACQIRPVKSQRGCGPIHPNSPITPARHHTSPEFQIRWSTGRDHEMFAISLGANTRIACSISNIASITAAGRIRLPLAIQAAVAIRKAAVA